MSKIKKAQSLSIKKLPSRKEVLQLMEEENKFWDNLSKAQREKDLKFGDSAREEENG